VITCLGDTLPHLSTQTEVARVLDRAAALLAPGGRLLLGFRDYHASPLEGPARFIPVRSDADRILTCFLEYDQEQVMVHDLLHERRGPSWDLRVGSYRKLRLDPRWVADRLRAAGLAVRELPRLRGMVTIVGQRVA
jgi:hypothetical protein